MIRKGTLLVVATLVICCLMMPAVCCAQGARIKNINKDMIKEQVTLKSVTVISADMFSKDIYKYYRVTVRDEYSKEPMNVYFKQKISYKVGDTVDISGVVIDEMDSKAPGRLALMSKKGGVNLLEPPWLYIIIAAGVLIILIIVLVVQLMPGKESKFDGSMISGSLPRGGGMSIPPANPIMSPIAPKGPVSPPPPPPPPIGSISPNIASQDDRTITVSQARKQPSGDGGSDDQTIQVLPVRAYLTVSAGPDSPKRFDLLKKSMTLGRGTSKRPNDIVFTDGTVGKTQAKIVFNEETKTFRIINEGEANPVKVNGNVVDSVALANGDAIEFGITRMQFNIQQ